jgi:hypothetical protein
VSGDRAVSVSRVIPAPADAIFAVLRDPAMHAVIDGSGTVKGQRSSEPLELGSRFSMNMRMGLPYIIGNTVVEYEQDRLIAWRHVGRHRWRYELEPVETPDGSAATRVTETFDWSTALVPQAIELAGYPKKHPPAMELTLARLERAVCPEEHPTPGH